MKRFLPLAASVVLLPAWGCVSKSTAEARARAAFLAGQNQAIQQQLQPESTQAAPARANTVTIHGQVRHPRIPWTNDLTLAKAILLADYHGLGDPRVILIRRQGQILTVDPRRLLAGTQDPLLQPGDVVDLVQ